MVKYGEFLRWGQASSAPSLAVAILAVSNMAGGEEMAFGKGAFTGDREPWAVSREVNSSTVSKAILEKGLEKWGLARSIETRGELERVVTQVRRYGPAAWGINAYMWRDVWAIRGAHEIGGRWRRIG